MYQKLADISTFPHANYKCNIGWTFIDTFRASKEKVDLNPDYQRGFKWTQEQKERYIEYRLRDGRSGNIIYWNCPNWNFVQGNTEWHETLELVDGKQRLNAVMEFLNNKVKAFGKTLSEYQDGAKYIGRTRFDFEFHVNVLATKKEVVEWYIAMNNGGSIHTDEDLKIAYDVLNSL